MTNKANTKLSFLHHNLKGCPEKLNPLTTADFTCFFFSINLELRLKKFSQMVNNLVGMITIVVYCHIDAPESWPCYQVSMCTSNVTSRGVSYMCNRCSGWVHSKCSGLQNAAEYRRIKNWACISCSSPPTPQIPKPLPSPITTKASDGDPFTILQFNANGIGNKQVELGDFLERHKVSGSDSGIEAYLKFSDHSKKRL